MGHTAAVVRQAWVFNARGALAAAVTPGAVIAIAGSCSWGPQPGWAYYAGCRVVSNSPLGGC